MSVGPQSTTGPDAGLCDRAAELADVIESARHPDASSTAPEELRERRLPPRALPGFGAQYDGSEGENTTACGDPVPQFCSDCGSPTTVGSTCKRSICERCAPAWARDRTESIVETLDATARVMSSERETAVYKHHVIVSPDPSWFTSRDDPLDATFQVIQRLLKTMDAEGVVAYHPWSGAADHGDDLGEWQDRLFEGRSWADVRDELELRPHFHAVVCSPRIWGGSVTRDLERETGWVVNRVEKRDGSGRSLEDLHDVCRAVSYALSHTGIDVDSNGQNNAEYRRFGSVFTSSRLDVLPETERKTREALREVVPHTLGIDPGEIRCESDVQPQVVDWNRAYAAASDSDGGSVDSGGGGGGDDPNPDAGDSDMPGSPETRTVGGEGGRWTSACLGELRHVRHASEVLDDDEWREQAEFVESLESVYAAWQRDEWEPGDGVPPD